MKANDQNSFRLKNIEKNHVFLVPENYFESFENKIENRILELNAAFKKQVFELPESYFVQSSISINKKITLENSLDNPNLKKMVFQAPEGYLVSMEDGIKAKIQPEKETKEELFVIPENYFETLSDKIQDKIGEKDNVIKFDFASSSVVRYSIAASVALVLAASALFFVVRNQEQPVALETKPNFQIDKVLLANLDKNEVKLYLEKQESELEMQDLIEFVSEKKKQKIKSDFEKEIISVRISENEKKAIELEISDIDADEFDI